MGLRACGGMLLRACVGMVAGGAAGVRRYAWFIFRCASMPWFIARYAVLQVSLRAAEALLAEYGGDSEDADDD